MTHDIIHCNYNKCPLKDTCYRYQMHLDAVKRKLTFLTYLKHDKTTKFTDGNCSLYWKLENE